MNTLWQVPAVLLAVLAWLNAPPSGLADIAARETLRRQATPQSTANLTNLNMPPEPVPNSAVSMPPPEPPPATDPATASAAAAGVAAAKPAGAPKDEVWWRNKIGDLRTNVDRGQIAVEALQSRINALQTDAVNLDDPIRQARARNDLAKALEELDRTNKKLDEDRKAIAALQDEARRSNVPAGWIR
jgi:hypothetical protein